MLFLYLFMASGYFSFLLFLIIRDEKSSLKDLIHLKVAIVAALLWPIVIPLSLLELKLKANRKSKATSLAAFPRPATMSDGEIGSSIAQNFPVSDKK